MWLGREPRTPNVRLGVLPITPPPLIQYNVISHITNWPSPTLKQPGYKPPGCPHTYIYTYIYTYTYKGGNFGQKFAAEGGKYGPPYLFIKVSKNLRNNAKSIYKQFYIQIFLKILDFFLKKLEGQLLDTSIFSKNIV